MLFQRLNQFTEEVKRQGATTGSASWYRGHRARGCLIWPFVCTVAYSSEPDGRGEDKSVSSSTRCIASSGPHSNSCSCMPLLSDVHWRVRHGRLLPLDCTPHDACIMPAMPSPANRLGTERTAKQKGRGSGTKCSANQNNHTGLCVPQQVRGVAMKKNVIPPWTHFPLALTQVPALNHTQRINVAPFR